MPEEKEEDPRLKPTAPGETPEQAFARRQEELAEKEAEEPESFLARESQPWKHGSSASSESRLSTKGRFPSRDVWEDSPDSLQLHATVAGPQGEDKDAPALPTTTKPQVPVRPVRTKSGESLETAHPVVPGRPSEKTQQLEGTSPPLATKSKPQVPARPSKPLTRDSSENVSLSKVSSNSSAKSTGSDQGVSVKAKPPVPSRPVGGKIAALQSGFMLDLNKRLKLGPQAPKKEDPVQEQVEEEKEKAPLVDARKGRARGPARRAPAKSPAPVADLATAEKSVSYGISAPSTLWQIHPDEDLLVSSHQEEVAPSAESKPSHADAETLTSDKPEHEAQDSSVATETLASQASQASTAEEAQAKVSVEPAGESASADADTHDVAAAPVDVEPSKETPVVPQDTEEPDTAAEEPSTLTESPKANPEDVVE